MLAPASSTSLFVHRAHRIAPLFLMDSMHEGLPKTGDVLLGKYLLEQRLGEGGMGVVFAARHEILGQRVAVKLVQPSMVTNQEAVARFVNEARASARIDNDHVARVLDVGTIDGNVPYMVLEYLDGEDLEHVVDRRGLLPVAELVDTILEAIEGVASAHAVGIVHRDLKPSNLFVAKRPDGTTRVKVLDFGISKMAGDPSAQNVTRTNSVLGSPLYMSPEQLRNAKTVDQRSDIWAFGVILYQLLTGRPPFDGDNAVALFAAIQESDPPGMLGLRTDVSIPAGLETAVLKCLERKPEDRYRSLDALAADLAPYASPDGMRSVDNSRRILGAKPPTPTAVPDALVQSGPSQISGAETVDARHVQTAGSWSEGALANKPKRSGALWLLLVIPVLAIAGLGALFVFGRTTPKPPTVTSATATTATIDPPATASAPAVDPAPTTSASAVAVEPTVAATTTAAPTASAAPTTTAKKAVMPPAHPKPKNCDPPYEFDSTGKKHWKTECL